MNSINCKIKGCKEVFLTEEAVSPLARFVCKNHPRSVQLAEVGRVMTEKDEKDKEVHFQECQFDPGLASGASPQVDSFDEAVSMSNEGGPAEPVNLEHKS